ncbi:carbohydrate-binding module family 5 protein [Paxillus involutus ATCC 200175]|uniref:Carbohydrate-binding module family 5 protein n=1 Tax=Paxillus involutus ATCC 200175 TaxID=664439 RepID=A0A0C9U7B8_PAXIN|nr:carbohydrate-binding module family 5 protein [Paxillus involutus ATCC 200175]
MIPTTFFAAAVVLSSFLAITDGVVVPRDGTFTYLTPQPTAPGTTTPVTSIASTHSTQSTQSTYSSQSTLNPWTYSTTPSTTSTYATSSTPYTTSSTPYTTSSTPYTTQSTPYTTQSTHSTQPTYTSPTTSQTTYPTNTGHGSVYPQPSSGPNPSPVQSNCDGVQPWQANLAYVAGNNVVFNGKLYTANQWSYNNSPATSAGEWTLDCDCSIPIGNKADCTGVAAWQKSQAYSAGSKVVYNGHLWVAVQWTSSNVPGDTSGTWKDLGVCA